MIANRITNSAHVESLKPERKSKYDEDFEPIDATP